MTQIAELGRRIELVSMDPHCHDITIGLYRDVAADQAVEFTAFSYSRRDGAVERVGFVNQAMKVLGGLEASPDAPDRLRFPCGQEHRRAVQRLFIEACKIASSTPLEPRAMNIFDKKSQLTMTATGEGGGRYRVTSDGTGSEAERRVDAVTRGLVRLADLESLETGAASFPCGHTHDRLVGLLLKRALNVRVAMREAEAAAARGIMAAPSQQQAP